MTHLRFGIRDLLWAMVVLGLLLLLWLQRIQAGVLSAEKHSLLFEIGLLTEKLAQVGYKVERDEGGNIKGFTLPAAK
jgi:hypothetical protein